MKGKIEGKVEGKIEGKIEVAKKLLDTHLSIALISEATGLSLEEIEKIATKQ
jgi:predicted transposase/invertase (TIGR01784 family)